jgi:DNA mismatch repair protein MutS
MTEPSTPLMRQYSAIKKEHPAALLFFRLGDFYEMFFEDAVVASKELEITLTSRNKEKGLAIPMCGVPYHAAEGYISKLVRRGYRVAICEQVEDPRLAKTLVRREVRRVVTPGTAADSALAPEENNFLAAAVSLNELAGSRASGNTDGRQIRAGFAALDLSTGEFRATEFSGENAEKKIQDELDQLRPKELLYASSAPLFDASGQARTGVLARPSERSSNPWALTPVEDWTFSPEHAIPLLENHFGVLSLEGFGLAGKPAAAAAAGSILHYVRSTQRGGLDHVDRIGFYERQSALVLDAVTVRNLELLEPLFAGGDAVTLFRVLDATSTPMGRRLLRAWMLRPSIEEAEIGLRLDAVEALVKHTIVREELRRALSGILDLERLLSRVTLETANPRDLLALGASLARIPGAKAALANLDPLRLESLYQKLDELTDVRCEIERTINPEPPIALNGGGVIAAEVDRELDELRGLSRNGKQFLAQMEERERERTGIGSLKVRFNSVFGYYLEISKSNLHLVPPDYERRQTLANAERFSTPELKEYELKILDAEQKIVEIERRIFAGLRSRVAGEARRIRQSALALAEIDVLANFAQLGAERGYSRPQFDQTGDLEIIAGRHPVIEQQDLSGQNPSAYDPYKNDSQKNSRFVPNDLYLNSTTDTLLLVTGPNMGGKSTYLRQTALIVIMAQMGSFVPATKTRLSVVDRVFTRIGASDNLARGRSTFMVEMTETAAILNTATARSLILLDEVGRGTATYDGLAIAWAAIEYLHARTQGKTLFATHYFELTELAEQLSGVKNYHLAVKETPSGIVFLRQVSPGPADRSYGIEVAKLAGLPDEVIRRAREVLAEHENAESRLTAHIAGRDSPERRAQLTIFTPLSQPVVEKIRELDLDSLTPLEALNLLAELKKQVQ